MHVVTTALLSAAILICAETYTALAAERCTLAGAVKRCEASFGPGTYVSYGDSTGDVNRLVIDDPDTSVEPEKLLVFFGATLMRLAPRLTADQRGEAFKKLLSIGASDTKERLRLGDWDWTAVWKSKHLTLSAQRRK